MQELDDMEYEDRIVCFIDVLGFKSAIEQSLENQQITNELYKLINELTPTKISDLTYGQVPVFDFQTSLQPQLAKDYYQGGQTQEFQTVYPLAITQFSDSFVISCPADNKASHLLLLKAVFYICAKFFEQLGMLVRGGISIGKVIHESSGPLFGPAMNEAYRLESKCATYPRIIFTEEVKNKLDVSLHGHPYLNAIIVAEDNGYAIDLIGIFRREIEESLEFYECFENQLAVINEDVSQRSPGSVNKIQYLIKRFESLK